MKWFQDFLKGMEKRGNNFVMILDIDKVFSQDETEMTQNIRLTA